jgi:GntR family transcriptional regulator
MTSMVRVERDSPVTAWGQIVRNLRTRIERGDLDIGTRMPAEHDLAIEYGVSRITIRQALAILAKDGLIERRQGTGTFVAQREPSIQHDLFLSTPWRDRLVAEGHRVASVVVDPVQSSSFPAALSRVLGQEVLIDRPAVFVSRVQHIDDLPIGITESWLDAELVGDLADGDLIEGSLSITLERRRGLKPAKIDNYLEASTADAIQARLLATTPDVAVFVVSAASYLADGRVLEISRTSWLGNRVRFHLERDSA